MATTQSDNGFSNNKKRDWTWAWVLAAATLSLFLAVSLPVPHFLNPEFLLTFLGAFLGLAIATITLFYGVAEKLYSGIDSLYRHSLAVNDELAQKLRKASQQVDGVVSELRSDTFALFWLVVAELGIAVLQLVPLPPYLAPWPLPFSVSVSQFLVAGQYVAVALGAMAVWDIMVSLFKIIDVTILIRGNDLTSQPPTPPST